MPRIITRDSFNKMLETHLKKDQVIGRALVVLFNRQNQDERQNNTTQHLNLRGFTPGDARSGCITAKYFIKHKTLLDWQIERWMKKNDKGIPRIAKYWAQLDEAAREKQAAGGHNV